MRLIDFDVLLEAIEKFDYGFIDEMTCNEVISEFKKIVNRTPTVDAVPLDKLCEWLERFATMDCEGCREAFGSCEDEESFEVSVCNSRERWKAMLTKWMEEQHDHN